MKKTIHIPSVIGVWLFVSFIAGAIMNRVKWGDPGGFHGIGWPVPMVLWDKHPTTGKLADFVTHPIVMVLNPMLVFVAGALLIFVAWSGTKMFCRLRKRS